MKIMEISAIDITIYKFLLPLMNELKKNGDEVIVASNIQTYRKEFEELGYSVKQVDFVRNISPIANMKAFWQLVKLFKSEKPDCIHVHTPIASILARLAGAYCKVPVKIYTLHGLYSKFPFLQIEKFVCRYFTDYIFTVNPTDREYLISHKFVKEDKVSNLNSVGISTKKFNPENVSEAEKEKLRLELGLNFKLPVVGFVGRLVKEKGILELIEAFIKVRQEMECQLLVIGSSEFGERDSLTVEVFKQKIEESGFSENIILAGHREDMVQCLSLMDVFVLPSYREGMAVSPLEAMSMEIPVIVTDIKGCREEITEETGIKVPVQQIEPLAAAIKQLLNDKEKSQKIGKLARNRVIEEFETDRVVEEQMKVFREKFKKF